MTDTPLDPEIIPTPGMGVTLPAGSDRYPGTIMDVQGDTILVQEDKAIRVDDGGPFTESQSYSFESNPDAPITAYTKRGHNLWVRKGESTKKGSRCYPGNRSKYLDPSF